MVEEMCVGNLVLIGPIWEKLAGFCSSVTFSLERKSSGKYLCRIYGIASFICLKIYGHITLSCRRAWPNVTSSKKNICLGSTLRISLGSMMVSSPFEIPVKIFY